MLVSSNLAVAVVVAVDAIVVMQLCGFKPKRTPKSYPKPYAPKSRPCVHPHIQTFAHT